MRNIKCHNIAPHPYELKFVEHMKNNHIDI